MLSMYECCLFHYCLNYSKGNNLKMLFSEPLLTSPPFEGGFSLLKVCFTDFKYSILANQHKRQLTSLNKPNLAEQVNHNYKSH